MSQAARQTVSAQVLLAPASRENCQPVVEAFRKAGFEVGSPAGGNFSITAAASVFQKYFELGERIPDKQIALKQVPIAVRPHIQAIVIPKPPDFGPWGNF